MNKNQKLVVAKIFLLVGTFLVVYKLLGISHKKYLPNSQICPNFGNLSQLFIPERSLVNKLDSIKVAVLDKKGDKRLVSKEHLDGALFIKSKEEFEEFLNQYDEICGGKPDFYSSIDFLRIQKLKTLEAKRKNLSSLAEQSSLANQWRKLQSEKENWNKKIYKLNNELSELKPLEYKIIGRLAEETPDSFIIFGSSIPESNNLHSTEGVVNNGVIILKRPSKKDIVSPHIAEYKHVLANHYKFIKRIDSRDSFGSYMPISIFERSKKKIDKAKIDKIEHTILVIQKKILKIDKNLKDIEQKEEKYLASTL
jgi:hypothetical protein